MLAGKQGENPHIGLDPILDASRSVDGGGEDLVKLEEEARLRGPLDGIAGLLAGGEVITGGCACGCRDDTKEGEEGEGDEEEHYDQAGLDERCMRSRSDDGEWMEGDG